MRRLLLIGACIQLTAGLEASAQEVHASPLEATWTLAPAFSTMCSAGPVSLLVTVGRVYTHHVEPDSLAIASDVAVSGNGMTILATHRLAVGLDSVSGAFTFAGPVSGSAQRSGGSGTLAGKLEVRGKVEGVDRIRAYVRTSLSMRVHGGGAAYSGACTPVHDTIVATRLKEEELAK